MSNAPILKVENLCKSFDKLQVLRGIDLNVSRGEVVAIIGPSGSGKSTLLRCINFLEQPTVGRIYFDGESVGQRAHGSRVQQLPERELNAQRLRIGMVFQRFNLFPHMTVLSNVICAKLLTTDLSTSEAVRKGEQQLEKVGLIHKRDEYPHRLSTGQQQRVAIARALIMEPELILFDEPTSALDPELVAEVLAVIEQLAAEGMTMIIVTHEMHFARHVADRIVFIDGGLVRHEGSPDSVFDGCDDPRVAEFIGRLTHRQPPSSKN